MEKTFFDRFLNILLILLVIAVLGGIGYLGYKYYEKYKINNDAAEFLDNEFEKYISDRDDYDEQEAIDEQGDGDNGPRGIDADGLQYRGYRVEGKIELPTVNLRYPVLEYITDANELEVSIGIQYGVGLNKVGNTVLAGHNYRSGLFFGSNKLLNIGDPVYITDTATGQRVEYKIYQKYTTEEDDTSYFGRDTQGKREISLVTCQSNNKYRLVIWAREV
ncbi:MAG: sortase [Clostridia bacterium]|nr:sortase [Clostridia bacterium]